MKRSKESINSISQLSEMIKARFWSHVKVRKVGECWLWEGKPSSHGYGTITIKGRSTYAHVVSFVIFNSSIRENLVVDHICRIKNCVNPHHLRAVTHRTNSLENSDSIAAINFRKTHCKHGHEFNGETSSVRITKYGISRTCKVCMKIRNHKRYKKVKK